MEVITDYTNIETDALLSQVKEIAEVLKERLDEGESKAKELSDKIDELSSVMDADGMKRHYTLIVSTDDVSFDVEWHNQTGEFGKYYSRNDGETGIPEEELLERNPALWLFNLQMGKYDLTKF